MNDLPDFIQTLPGAVTVCDANGVIIYMNKKSIKNFQSDGGDALIGRNLSECHPAAAKSKLNQLLENQMSNVYTVEKHGEKKLIYQAPWYRSDGKFGGLVEFSLEIPIDMQHFIRGE